MMNAWLSARSEPDGGGEFENKSYSSRDEEKKKDEHVAA